MERIFRLSEDFAISAMLMSGQGEAYYQYDKKYRKEKVWSEEIIDKTTFGVQKLSLQVSYQLIENLWLGINGTVRNTSPVELLGTPEALLKKPEYGLTVQYEIF